MVWYQFFESSGQRGVADVSMLVADIMLNHHEKWGTDVATFAYRQTNQRLCGITCFGLSMKSLCRKTNCIVIENSCEWEMWVHLGMQAGIETAMLFLDEGETVSAILFSAINISCIVLLAVLIPFCNHFWWFFSKYLSYKLLVEFIFIPLIC